MVIIINHSRTPLVVNAAAINGRVGNRAKTAVSQDVTMTGVLFNDANRANTIYPENKSPFPGQKIIVQ